MYSNENNADIATEFRDQYCTAKDDPMCSDTIQHEAFSFEHTDPDTDYNKIGRCA